VRTVKLLGLLASVGALVHALVSMLGESISWG
jgi:hypothetical protein